MPERDALASLHRYTRLTLLATVPIIGLAPLLVAFGDFERWDRFVPLVVAVAVLLVVHWRRVARAIEAPTEVLPWRPSAVTLVLSFAVYGYAYTYGDAGNTWWMFLPSAPLAELQFGRKTSAALRLSAPFVLFACVLAVALAEVVPPDTEGSPVATGLVAAVVMLVLPFGELVALRQWRIAVELDQARRTAAELGATRERLRFTEDLHDILGHALEVVSLKAELAARLGTAAPERAQAEMAEVQRLARGALRDVRALARGQRPLRLDAELTGARTLLTSAGIECEVDGAATGGEHSELLGRVLREAVTNLLRHADTRHCRITVRPSALTVVNDGAAAATAGEGTGLAALSRRVTEAGGTFLAGPGETPGTFVVEAAL
ncbi:sensor histidine kinase [Actinophytocola algeriensis]|uniref:Two-component system sensor histidine kinase DesK n=1 Tax=Actinophytocola algeriensis TaxID=1768010 RepID=A0A7W7QCY6_9PSEU|nr:histidine kinase [Actinophytocola algeriensis]MBB4911342.1 two-component system sensor histidine kinase DesK [Actinophytocola algeriensis]MBE1479281.1 two-component system sensor histidine kinase DesK [Actinophytocola algeriensis]